MNANKSGRKKYKTLISTGVFRPLCFKTPVDIGVLFSVAALVLGFIGVHRRSSAAICG
jgi:hypothetical protein